MEYTVTTHRKFTVEDEELLASRARRHAESLPDEDASMSDEVALGLILAGMDGAPDEAAAYGLRLTDCSAVVSSPEGTAAHLGRRRPPTP